MEQNENFSAPSLPSDEEPSPGLPDSRASGDAPGFLPVPVRERRDGWTPAKQRGFIEHLAETLSTRAAAEAVGMTEQSANRLRRRADAAGFAAAWDAVLRGAFGRLAASALERAVNGTLVRRFHHGKLLSEDIVHSERMTIFLLQKGERLLGRDAGRSNTVAADWEGALDRLESGTLEEGWQLWRNEDGVWLTDFPPPDGFGGYEEGHLGEEGYSRTLTDGETDVVEAREQARLASARARRDAFFGPDAYRDPPPRRSRRR